MRDERARPRRCFFRVARGPRGCAETRDRTGDLQIFSLTLSQLAAHVCASPRADCPDASNFASDWRCFCLRALGPRTRVILDMCATSWIMSSICVCQGRSGRMRKPMVPILAGGSMRHRGDSNPCGQSPMDFESISLAARTQCLCVAGAGAADIAFSSGAPAPDAVSHEAAWSMEELRRDRTRRLSMARQFASIFIT